MVNANEKNIWIAASDGDLERVKVRTTPVVQHFPILTADVRCEYTGADRNARYVLTEIHTLAVAEQSPLGMSPNAEDENTYTPMHAAASYAHLDLLEYLISKGGDINHPDSDGETPLFTVESVQVAQWMIERGAKIDVRNHEGDTVAEYLFEDNPEVAMYIQSLLQPASSSTTTAAITSDAAGATIPTTNPSAYQTEALTTSMTDDLISRTGEIMRDAEARGYNPDERLREVVSAALMDGWRRNREEAGLDAGLATTTTTTSAGLQGGEQDREQEGDSKRSRME
ncbi:hypothetical protein QFC19_009348 [Naganishia cerealis]|uniref:Uncharacterized protein n=1 Tax=Naganishia cerealis TaxID=610337 RepID=A0ACC2UVE1_9TREE|nr:hypothetical protein QFC19_009348 [Naganishia cerealis]